MLTVKIETDNEAFEDGARGPELARILRKIAARVDDLGSLADGGKVMDVNGNSVGHWEVR